MEGLKLFRYFLLIDRQRLEIPHAPIGWEDARIEWKRSFTDFSIGRTFSLPFEFTLAAKKYLTQQLINRGIDGDLSLLIRKLDHRTEDYVDWAWGALDLSNSSFKISSFETNILESSFESRFKALESTKFDLNLDTGEYIDLPGIPVTDYSFSNLSGTFISSNPNDNTMTLGAELQNSQIDLDRFDTFSPAERIMRFSDIDWETLDSPFLEANWTGSVSFALDMEYNIRQVMPFVYFTMIVRDNTGEEQLLYTSEQLGNGDNIAVKSVFNINIVNERRYFIVLKKTSVFPFSSQGSFVINNATLRVSTAGSSPSRRVQAISPKRLAEKIVSQMNMDATVTSDMFDSRNDLMITSGEAIRGLSAPFISTSFKDFYDSINATNCIGKKIVGDNVVIENREYFFRTSYLMADIGQVKDVEVKPFTELVYSEIKTGYADNNYDRDYGRQEFNSTQVWSTTSKRVSRTLDIISPYRADQFGINELMLAKDDGDNDSDKDKEGDKDVFMVQVNPDGTPVTGAQWDLVTGFPNPNDIINLGLSPKQNMIRHMDFIRSSFHGVNENGYISIASAMKFSDFTTRKGDVIVRERDPIYIRDHFGRIFLPFVISFTTDYPKNLVQMVSSEPEGVIRVHIDEYIFTGFVLDVSCDITKNSPQEMSILLTTDNNPLDLNNL